MGSKLGQHIIDILRGKKKIIAENRELDSAKKLFEYGYHAKPQKEIKFEWAQSPEAENKNDLKILEKLKFLYANNKEIFSPTEVSDMWQDIFIPKHQKLFNYLKENEDEKALDFLNNMCKNQATYGFFAGCENDDETQNQKKKIKKNKYTNIQDQSLKFYLIDPLVSFAEWLNVIPAESVDNTSKEDYIYYSPETLIDLIEKKLGFEIKVPEFQTGLTGIPIHKNCINNRHIIYLYIALRIKEFCKDIENPRICEIGGGVGLLSFYCNLIGLKNVTMVDIPSVSFISSYFMMKNMPERKFILSTGDNKYDEPEAIKILFPKYFNEAPDNQFDIVVNCDSFPEINKEVTREYLETIKRTSRIFYSINHEWHEKSLIDNNVPNLTDYVGGFDKKFRNLFWLRRGYIEELYKINRGA